MTKSSEEELSILLDYISWGLRIIEIDSEIFAFRSLTTKERAASQLVRKYKMQTAIRAGVPLRDQLEIDAKRQGLWSQNHDDQVKQLQDELQEYQQELDKAIKKDFNKKDGAKRIIFKETRAQKKGSSKNQQIRKRIEYIKKRLEKLLSIHTQLIELPSAEHQADEEHAIYVIRCATLTFPELKQLWQTHEDILNDTNTERVVKLIGSYSNYELINTKQIRELARSGIWRIRWSTAKSCGGCNQLFTNSLNDLTQEQMLLLHWSQVYDSVYESIERPPDYVIDDDSELDRWIERQIRQQEQERRKNFQSKKSNLGIGKTSEANADEVMRPVDGFYSDTCNCGAIDRRGVRHANDCPYGVYFYYDQERIKQEVEQLQSANPNQIRQILAREQKRLEGKGWVREEHLRAKVSISAMGFKVNTHKQGDRPI